jgi:protein arginine kinase
MGIIDSVGVSTINDILLLSQPAHLMKYYGKDMDADKRDIARAEMVREKLS